MFEKPIVPKKKKATSGESRPPEEVYLEVQNRFQSEVCKMAKLLEWKETTVAGLIIQASEKWYWRGQTPFEISAQMVFWLFSYGELTRSEARQTFLGNL